MSEAYHLSTDGGRDELTVVRDAMNIIKAASDIARNAGSQHLYEVMERTFINIGCILNETISFERKIRTETWEFHDEASASVPLGRLNLVEAARKNIFNLHFPANVAVRENDERIGESKSIANENHSFLTYVMAQRRRKRGEMKPLRTQPVESILSVGKEELQRRLASLEKSRASLEIQRLHAEDEQEREDYHVLHESTRLVRDHIELYFAFRDTAGMLADVKSRIGRACDILDAEFKRIHPDENIEDDDGLSPI